MCDSPQQSRAKRQRIDKTGRFAALERLKNLKGNKNKYEVGVVDNVYEEVTEKEYAKRVLSRAGDDWIEDDGTGYVEDGREIFDEDSDNEEEDNSKSKKKNQKSEKNNKKRLRDINKPVEGNGSIRSLFGNLTSAKKEKVKLEDDEALADVLGLLDSEGSTSNGAISAKAETTFKKTETKSKIDDAALVKEYMANLRSSVQRKPETKKEANSDDEMLERILKPSTKDTSNIRRSMKRLREDNDIPPAVKKPNIPQALIKETAPKVKDEVTSTMETSNIDQISEIEPSHFHDDDDDDIDFSMLDDDENQFGNDESKSAEMSTREANAKVEQIKADILKKESNNYANLLSSWENACSNDNDDDDDLLGSIDVDEASFTNSVQSKSTLRFWYWDAYEDPNKFPGKVFLFGRMPSESNPREFKSVCITVENVERSLYLLPRKYALDPITLEETDKEVTIGEIYHEFNEYCQHSFKSKKVEKHFAFNVPGVKVPQTSEYLHVLYDGKYPAPDPKKKFLKIAHIFGCYTNPLETFLLNRKIKGPCWLNISNYELAKVQQSTWCNLAINCRSPSSITIVSETKVPPPPLVIATLYVRTALHPKTQTNEIVTIVCLVNHRFAIDKKAPTTPFTRRFCGFTRPSTQNWPMGINDALGKYKAATAVKLDSERALLSWFLTTFKNIDADLVVTHDANDCQLDIICDRISAIKLPMWSRLGRLNLSTMPKKFKDYFVGRMICDVKSSAEELIKSRSYDLETLCQNVLKIEEDQRIEVSNEELYDMYESPSGILKLITLTLQDCLYVMRIMCELNVLPLALQITNICGNLMSRTLQGGRSERNEYLLLHSFEEKDYIVPDKKPREINWNKDETMDMAATQMTQTQTQMTQTQMGSTQMGTTQMAPPSSGRKKPAYTGGLVLDPIKGFYDQFILLMDFNSLYPSIIQEYNICFTTVDQPDNEDDPIEVPDPKLEQGVLPRQIRSLVDRRREVKKLIVPGLEPDLKNQYNIRQLALKLTANSMYGCLGFSNSRFYAKHLAALVTQKGRDILLNTKDIVTKLNFEVIYGDTDSIMINTHSTDYDEVFKIGHSIKQAVNKIYRQVELDIDGVYKYMLLLNKKKYAAVTVTKLKSGELVCQQEHKGLDIVRRDWSQISVIAGKMVLDQLLCDVLLDERVDSIHSYLEEIRENIKQDKVPVAMLTITKQLTKNPREYSKIQSMPHVQVALRMNATKNKRFKRGDMVSYVICEDGTDNNPMQRGYHLDELKSDPKLKIDKEYYLSNQIHPVVSRLLKPIAGTDSARIAQCLGLDPNKYREGAQRTIYDNERSESIGESIIQSNATKYRDCDKFTFKCIGCKVDNVIAKPFVKLDNNFVPVLQQCTNKECNMAPIRQMQNIQNHLALAIRNTIRNYYDNWMICDEPNCNQNTRTYVHVTDAKGRPICLTCKRGFLVKTYTEGSLYKQLRYYHFMFDLPKFDQSLIRVSRELENKFTTLREFVEQTLKRSGYQNIKLSSIFQQPNKITLNNHLISEK